VPAAVVLSPADYQSLVATNELMRNPEARQRFEEYERATAAGHLEWVTGSEAEQQQLA
jgi:PHD/YefM family antitoxin component YafN of YafNO toxin-antitoxin module